MKKFLMVFVAVFLQGCDYVDRKNASFINAYASDCRSKGYDSVSVSYIGGLVSSYYSCTNKGG